MVCYCDLSTFLLAVFSFAAQGAFYPLARLSETHEMLRQTCRDFADKELKPIAGVLDKVNQMTFLAATTHLYKRSVRPCVRPSDRPRLFSNDGHGCF